MQRFDPLVMLANDLRMGSTFPELEQQIDFQRAIDLRYQSSRHRSLMDESEQALSRAAAHVSTPKSRVAKQILTDAKLHRLWESQHAELMLSVAEHRRRSPQVLALRTVETGLLHRGALIDHIRRHKITGNERDRLFRVFYGPRDSVGSIVAEHRKFLLAVSSRISADHLIGIMQDQISLQLLEVYKAAYEKYFELFCLLAASDDEYVVDALRSDLHRAHDIAENIRRRLLTAKPDRHYSHFDRQALLARSGRYPILDYMVG